MKLHDLAAEPDGGGRPCAYGLILLRQSPLVPLLVLVPALLVFLLKRKAMRRDHELGLRRMRRPGKCAMWRSGARDLQAGKDIRMYRSGRVATRHPEAGAENRGDKRAPLGERLFCGQSLRRLPVLCPGCGRLSVFYSPDRAGQSSGFGFRLVYFRGGQLPAGLQRFSGKRRAAGEAELRLFQTAAVSGIGRGGHFSGNRSGSGKKREKGGDRFCIFLPREGSGRHRAGARELHLSGKPCTHPEGSESDHPSGRDSALVA